MAGAVRVGHAYVVIDGTSIPIDRVAADRPFYSGKHHRHGRNKPESQQAANRAHARGMKKAH